MVGFSAVLFQNNSKRSPLTTTTETTPSSDPTVGWKTYTDVNNSFEFKYPPTNYQVDPYNSYIIEAIDYPYKGSSAGPRLKITYLPTTQTEIEIANKLISSCEEGMGCTKSSSVTFGNNTFTNFLGPGYVVENQYFIRLRPDGKSYIQFVFMAFEKDIRDQILSTFKFTN